MNGEADHGVESADARGGVAGGGWESRARLADPLASSIMLALRTSRALTGFALLTLGAVASVNVHGTDGSGLMSALCVVLALFAVGVSFLITSPKAPAWPAARRWTALGVQAVATHLPFLLFEFSWGSMGGPLAGAVLYLLPLRVAIPLFGVIVSAQVAMGLIAGHSIPRMIYLGCVTAYIGVLLYALVRLTSLVVALDASRIELAHAAVARERQRFARDLHDLLGHSLSAITLKTELVLRLLPDRPGRAREEVGAVLGVSRRALADVRLVSSGYCNLTMESEAESCASILATSDIRTRTRFDCGPLDPVVDAVLATALREGVTNILRHSLAREVGITATRSGGTVRLTMVNDGVGGHAPISAGPGGSGLDNLRRRLESVGGTFRAGVGADGRFTLRAEAPAQPVVNRGPEDYISLDSPG